MNTMTKFAEAVIWASENMVIRDNIAHFANNYVKFANGRTYVQFAEDRGYWLKDQAS